MKQWNLGNWIGAAKIVIGQVGQYVSYFTLVFAGIAAYPVVAGWASDHNMSLPFWGFAFASLAAIVIICLGEYMLGQAPTYGFWWDQSHKHAKPLQDIEDRLIRIEDKLNSKATTGTSVPLVMRERHPIPPTKRKK